MIKKYQFSNRPFFYPSWKINYLFLQTFNPIRVKILPYFVKEIKLNIAIKKKYQR